MCKNQDLSVLELRNICKENISRVVRSDLGKDPMILPVIISV